MLLATRTTHRTPYVTTGGSTPDGSASAIAPNLFHSGYLSNYQLALHWTNQTFSRVQNIKNLAHALQKKLPTYGIEP